LTPLDIGAAGPTARGRRLPRNLARLMLLLAIAVPFSGIVYDINGATHARADVRVLVAVRALDGLQVTVDDHSISPAQADGSAPAGPVTTVVLRQNQYTDVTGHPLYLHVPGAPDGTWADADLSSVTLDSWDSTMPEQILARGGIAVISVCVGAGALMLYRILLSIAAGRPFEPGNPKRIAGLAGAIAVAAVVPWFLTSAAAHLVLHRVGLTGPHSPVTAPPVPSAGSMLWQLLVPLLVLALAQAFRRGGELTRDVEGLV